MGNREEFMWPKSSTLAFCNGREELLFISRNRSLDLADRLMLYWPHASRAVTFGLQLAKAEQGKWK